MVDEVSSEIEFNSMVAILKRLDMITYAINRARVEKRFDVMADALLDYFKEIVPDLTKEEMKIREDLKVLKRLTTPLLPENTITVSIKSDDVDIKLRIMAKRHGYLTKNIKNVRQAIIDM